MAYIRLGPTNNALGHFYRGPSVYLGASGTLGKPPQADLSALQRAATQRAERLAGRMKSAIELAEAAIPFMQTSAQRNLLQMIIEELKTFFPTGFGIIDQKGNTIKGSARLRSEASIRRSGDPISRPFLHDTRLFLSDQDSPFAAGRHYRIGDYGSRILLYIRRLEDNRPNELVAVAIHEMLHMMRHRLRSLANRFDATAASEFPTREISALLNLDAFAAHRAKMERHLATLVAHFNRTLSIRMEPEIAGQIASLLLEEVIVFVFEERVSTAIATVDSRREAARTRRGGIGIGVGFVPAAFLNTYLRRHWFDDPALQPVLNSVEAQRIIGNMSDDLRALVSAIQTQIGP